MPTQNKSRGFALLIKAPRVVRTFEPFKGETITILGVCAACHDPRFYGAQYFAVKIFAVALAA